MKTSFLCQTLGFWGRGKTIKEAAQNCRKAGASAYDVVVVNKFTHPTEDPKPAVVSGGLNVQHVEGSTNERVVEKVILIKLLQGKA